MDMPDLVTSQFVALFKNFGKSLENTKVIRNVKTLHIRIYHFTSPN